MWPGPGQSIALCSPVYNFPNFPYIFSILVSVLYRGYSQKSRSLFTKTWTSDVIQFEFLDLDSSQVPDLKIAIEISNRFCNHLMNLVKHH